jgi:hypothetical protein
MRAETLECGTVEFFTVIRMSDADEKLCTLLH